MQTRPAAAAAALQQQPHRFLLLASSENEARLEAQQLITQLANIICFLQKEDSSN
jgi:hypothetical protein